MPTAIIAQQVRFNNGDSFCFGNKSTISEVTVRAKPIMVLIVTICAYDFYLEV
jgi:hypothetical protein